MRTKTSHFEFKIMATSEILLLKKVDHLGYEGDVVRVRAGYARNFLLPQALAIPVTRANKKQIDALLIRRKEREAKELQEAKELAEKVRSLALSFTAKIGENGKMFGAITSTDVAKKMSELGFVIDRRKIIMEPAKHIGRATAKVRLHSEVVVDIEFDIAAEAPIA